MLGSVNVGAMSASSGLLAVFLILAGESVTGELKVANFPELSVEAGRLLLVHGTSIFSGNMKC